MVMAMEIVLDEARELAVNFSTYLISLDRKLKYMHTGSKAITE